jgi:hypothetical protein
MYKALIYVLFPKCSGKHYVNPYSYIQAPISHAQDHFCQILNFLTKYYPGHKLKYSDMERACSTYGREKRYMQDFGEET